MPFAFFIPSSKMSSVKRTSLIQICVAGSTYSRNETLFAFSIFDCTFGMIVISLTCSTESWSSIPKVRMLSIWSPKNSIRYGRSWENEKISTIPPRIENCPASYTKSTRSNSYSTRKSLMKSILSLSFARISRVFFPRSSLLITFSASASG